MDVTVDAGFVFVIVTELGIILVDDTTLVAVDVTVMVTVAKLVFVIVTVAAIEPATANPKTTKKMRNSFIFAVL